MTDRKELKRMNTEFERRLKLKQDQSYAIPNLPKTPSLSIKQKTLEDQIQEFTLHSKQDHLLLAVTLVTLVPDDERGIAYGETEEFRSLWDKFLIQAFAAHLPKRKRHYIISSVYHIHQSPTLHFHGIVAIPHELAHLVWKDGEIKKAISRTFKSWRKNEKNMT